MLHPLACRCGALKGTVDTRAPHHRIVCYCTDCQAYAHYLGRAGDMLDARGGSDVMQTVPSAITLTQGANHLACVRISEKGPLRWYADCCNTPIGNTGASHKLAFVGLLSSCLGGLGPALDEDFGLARLTGFTSGAKGGPKPRQSALVGVLLNLIGRSVRERFAGRHRRTPFFDVATDKPVAEPKCLTPDERARFVAAAA